MAPHVLILGGGVGGLVASNSLKRRLGRDVKVTLIERKRNFQFPPSYPWLMLGMRKPEETERSLSPLQRKGIDVVNAEVTSIDVGKKLVRTGNDEFSFDHLLIALGAELAPGLVPGLKEYGYHIYDLESALRFKEAIRTFTGGNIAVGISRIPFKCPAAPYETAMLLDHYFKKKKGLGDKVRISFFTPEGRPLPAAGPELGNLTLAFMKSRGIESKFKVKLTEVKPGEATFEDGSTLPFDLLFAVPPHKCPQVVADAGLYDQTGWVPVDPATMQTKFEGVYAVGDVTSVPTPSGYTPYLPKAGAFAHGQAEVVAHNIAVEVSGSGTKKVWDGGGSCFLMTGGEEAALVKGNWYVKPHPHVRFQQPSHAVYYERVLFEKYWMHHWFHTNSLMEALDAPIDWLHHRIQH